MERQAKKSKGRERSFAYISTHPVTEERAALAREAAGK
jgi:predicted Zn-dependent protease